VKFPTDREEQESLFLDPAFHLIGEWKHYLKKANYNTNQPFSFDLAQRVWARLGDKDKERFITNARKVW
jgi:hypothetical protein